MTEPFCELLLNRTLKPIFTYRKGNYKPQVLNDKTFRKITSWTLKHICKINVPNDILKRNTKLS